MQIIIIDDISTHYSITEKGQVYNNLTGYELKGTITNHGYKRVVLSMNRHKISKYVHRLMACAYLNFNEFSGRIINHKDGDKLNNCLENLRYITRSENSQAALYEQKNNSYL